MPPIPYTAVYLSLLFSLSASICPAASPPPFEWATSGGGVKNDKVRGLAVDKEGNVFLSGECAEEVSFGSTKIMGAGQSDVFVTKLDPKGNFLWSRLSGGPLIDRAYGVATDAKGNCYVTGHFQGATADFSGTTVTGNGDYDIFVTAYDKAGKLLWVRTAGGKGYDYGHAIAVDGKGDIVISGAVVGDATFGELTLPNAPGGHLFCAKYHPDGQLVWVKVTEGKAGGAGHGIAVDGSDNIYVGGVISGEGSFGGQALSSPKGSSAFVAKLSPAGDVRWTAQHQGEPSCLFHEITCDSQGRVWATGMFKSKTFVGTDVYATTGNTDSDALLCHYDTDGTLRWSRVGQGPGTDYGLGVATDGLGNSFLTGEFSDVFKIGGTEMHSRGSTDVYVSKFNPAGGMEWVAQAGGTSGDNAYTTVMDAQGGLFIAGGFSGALQLDQLTLNSVGGGDFYVAKLNTRTTHAALRLPRENLLVRHDNQGAIRPVTTLAEWDQRRSEILRAMQSVMGPLPGASKKVPLDVITESEEDLGTYVRRRITYQAERGGRVPAYLCIPKAALAPNSKAAAVLCLHPTDNVVGNDVVVGLGGKPNRQYAAELAERGFVTISPSYPQLAKYQPDLKALGYASGTMKAVWDNIRALDVLETLPFVKRDGYGAIGHSLGGHNAVYTAVFEPRIKAVVSSCGLDSYLDYYAGSPTVWQFGKGWCQNRYMPRLAEYADRLTDIPFDFSEMVGALAPRAVLISAPLKDANFQWQSVDRVAHSARAIYELHKQTNALQIEHPDCHHDFPDDIREKAYRMLEAALK